MDQAMVKEIIETTISKMAHGNNFFAHKKLYKKLHIIFWQTTLFDITMICHVNLAFLHIVETTFITNSDLILSH